MSVSSAEQLKSAYASLNSLKITLTEVFKHPKYAAFSDKKPIANLQIPNEAFMQEYSNCKMTQHWSFLTLRVGGWYFQWMENIKLQGCKWKQYQKLAGTVQNWEGREKLNTKLKSIQSLCMQKK